MKISPFCAVLLPGTILNPLFVQAACVTPPSCDELGFTVEASECSGTALKCPWDTSKAACKKKETAEEVKCYRGAILSGEGKCYSNISSAISPIGVVINSDKQLAIALTEVDKNGMPGEEKMAWSNQMKCNIADLKKCEYEDYDTSVLSCDADGQRNTEILLINSNLCNGTPAATACNLYEPVGCLKDFCRKGKWFLPSVAELADAGSCGRKGANILIQSALRELKDFGAAEFKNTPYWTSTVHSLNVSWMIDIEENASSCKYFVASMNKDNNRYVRPVIYYGESKAVCSVANCALCTSWSTTVCQICADGYNLEPSGLCESED